MSQPPVQEQETEKKSFWTAQRIAVASGVALLLPLIITFIVGFFGSRDGAGIEGTAAFIQILRDVFIIILAFQSIIIAVALAVLVLQVAGLINLLQNEIKPVLENIQATLNTARGTIRFVGDNVATPVIKAGGFIAGLAVFLREVGGIRRAVRPSSGPAELLAEDSVKDRLNGK